VQSGSGCQVHFIRNVLGKVLKKDRGRVASYLKEITRSETLESARKRLGEAVEALAVSHPVVAEFLDTYGEEMLAVYALPEHHRTRMRTTNMLERLNEEIRRRSRVIRIFPNEASCLRLVSALAMEANDEWMERKYLNMDAVEMLWYGTPVVIPHHVENAPRFPHFLSPAAVPSSRYGMVIFQKIHDLTHKEERNEKNYPDGAAFFPVYCYWRSCTKRLSIFRDSRKGFPRILL
jgi:hypothetical protein